LLCGGPPGPAHERVALLDERAGLGERLLDGETLVELGDERALLVLERGRNGFELRLELRLPLDQVLLLNRDARERRIRRFFGASARLDLDRDLLNRCTVLVGAAARFRELVLPALALLFEPLPLPSELGAAARCRLQPLAGFLHWPFE